MHPPIMEYLEELLRDAPDHVIPPQVRAHMERCSGCREEIRRMRVQSLLVRSLRTDEEVEPHPGFYGRVLENIEVRAGNSFWSAFLEPAFVTRLAFASTLLFIVLGAYLIVTEPRNTLSGNSPEVIMAVEPPPAHVVGFDRERDRETVLMTLATYRE